MTAGTRSARAARRTTVALAAVTGILAAGCTGGSGIGNGNERDRDRRFLGAVSLVAFDSCDEVLAGLRKSAKELVGPYGLQGDVVPLPAMAAEDGTESLTGGGDDARAAPREDSAPQAAAPDDSTSDLSSGSSSDRANGQAGGSAGKEAGAEAGGEDGEQAGSYSSTNVHEAGVDEPDLVKTDGRRIVTVTGGILRVVDVAGEEVTGTLDLYPRSGGHGAADLFLQGDQALVLLDSGDGTWDRPEPADAPAIAPQVQPERGDRALAPPTPRSRLVRVDLTGTPRVAGTLTVDGTVVDARQVGAVARVVVRSGPRLTFTYPNKSRSEDDAARANERVVEKAPIESWLPRYELEVDGDQDDGHVPCGRVSHPRIYTGTSMLTVYTLDLGGTLASGEPVTVVADGDTVYGTETSLYVTNDQSGRAVPLRGRGFGSQDAVTDVETEVFKFDISSSGPPRYVASGAVPGWLLNQYSLSEYDGHLRVATTSSSWSANRRSTEESTESAVYVLAQRDDELVEVGRVGGLGKGERIYAVRFLGPIGYVVTFRQVDPLYTLDLHDPKNPRAMGELKITGFSAYLHPVGGGRLIGVGQEASKEGRRLGTQVSLFDVSDLEEPSRLAQYHLKYGNSEVEFDPHAFLYWDGVVVVPVEVASPVEDLPIRPGDEQTDIATGERYAPRSAALVLAIEGDEITELGMVSHDDARVFEGQIRRALVIDDDLWTVSVAGLQANDIETLDRTAWVPFT